MLSRVANSVYWMCRYLERADNVARFIDVNAHLILDMGWERATSQWEPLVRSTGDEADFMARYGVYDEKSVIRFLTFDEGNPNSITRCVGSARENARTVREVITSEMWETINMLYHFMEKFSRKRTVENMGVFLDGIHTANHLFAGHMQNSMSNDEAWHFARMGKLIERADKTARLLDIKYFLLLPAEDHVGSVYDSVEWGAVLKSVSGFEMYQKRFHIANYRNVAEFLILDPVFPRAIRFCIGDARRALESITRASGVDVPATAALGSLAASLDSADIAAILEGGLHEFIDGFQSDLNAVDDTIHASFFALQKLP